MLATVLFDRGVRGAIGKGNRGPAIRESCARKQGGLLLGDRRHLGHAVGLSATVVCYEDLKTEAVQRLELENFPLLVTNDARGRDMYAEEAAKYRALLNA